MDPFVSSHRRPTTGLHRRGADPRRRRIAALCTTLAITATLFTVNTVPASAGTGTITGIGGKCVDITDASSANGAPVRLWTCNGTTAQQWTTGTDGTIRALGKCLDVTSGSTANGAKVQIWDCNGTGAQSWTANASGQLVNPQSGKCLDATDHSSDDGTLLQIWTCNTNPNQQWTLASPPATSTFAHPGVMVSRAQLDFVRTKVNAGEQPWKAAYDQMLATSYASLSRTPKPRSVVDCGPSSNPNNGCTDERQDAIAAYTDALVWYITGDSRYAAKSIALMDAWSAVITDHTNANAPLQTGWAGASWTRAAEIIRYTYSSWPNASRFGTMLRRVYLPEVVNGMPTYNGNWELVMMETAIGIGVFLEDRAVYNAAMAKFRARVRSFIYLTTDGQYPIPPAGTGIDTPAEIISYWQNQSTFVDGLTQETCRDFTHTGYGLSSISHVAETARIQGDDTIYTEVKDRLRHAMGLHTKYELGTAVPSWLCGGSVHLGLGPVTEVGFNALSFRLGIGMANSQTYTETRRPQGTNSLFVAWETLTHARNPN